MSEVHFHIEPGSGKEARYRQFLAQFEPYVRGERHATALLANTAAALREVFGFFWAGFYTVEGQQLVLGPFQGTMACSAIARGKGVCGTAWEQGRTLVVPRVEEFPGHIACSQLSRSEIVVPLVARGEVRAVLDIDSDRPEAFDDTDRAWLERLAALIAQQIYQP